MEAPAPSPRVLGRYVLGEEFARGGLATVHLGLARGEAGFSRAVAVKRLLPSFARDPEFLAAFVDEARLAARIRHPNVVPTLDVLAEDGELFVVMEYVHGESLARLARAASARGERIDLRVVSAIIVGVLHGLHAAHEARDERGAPLHLVHRDVSPQNVLVGADGVPRVLDFGIAKAAGRSQITREGLIKGKLGYMAPEQLRQSAERASDIYATGVCLWEALAMRRLFAGDNESVVLAKMMAGIVEPPSRYAADLPPDLEAVTMRALHPDPGQRFATAREMARAVEGAVAPASISEVGEWVERLAAESLTRRQNRIAEIEAGNAPGSRTALPAPQAAAEPAVSGEAPAPRSPRRPSRWIVWSGLGVLLAGAAGVATVLHGARARADREVGSAAPPATDSAPALPASISNTLPLPAPASAASAPPPSASASPSPRPRPAAVAAPRVSCDPPYSVGADGVRRYKKQCLR